VRGDINRSGQGRRQRQEVGVQACRVQAAVLCSSATADEHRARGRQGWDSEKRAVAVAITNASKTPWQQHRVLEAIVLAIATTFLYQPGTRAGTLKSRKARPQLDRAAGGGRSVARESRSVTPVDTVIFIVFVLPFSS